MNTYKGNAAFPEGPAPSSLEPPEIMISSSKLNYHIMSEDLKAALNFWDNPQYE